MPNRNVSIDFEKFVEIFNNDGKPTAKKYIEDTYDITYNIAQRRLVKETNYVFSRATKKYIVQNKTEEVFISTDKLFEGKFISKDKQSTLNEKNISFDDILTDILKDRLTELGKFFNISQSSKEISINMKLLNSSGYKVNILD
ncbi:hypothetical protein [Hathewaya massiliensis]|uniref:hypothetical protein n=1 Tax=Hathewaya massiliensis TaxID=1964382 RepID=UPI00115A0290|nr:hypothetical protein [Hathewaya massiliensis]